VPRIKEFALNHTTSEMGFDQYFRGGLLKLVKYLGIPDSSKTPPDDWCKPLWKAVL